MKRLLIVCLSLLTFSLIAQETATSERVSTGYRTVYTDIIIDASPEQVWAVLTDTKTYSTWADFLVDIQGTICDNCEIDASFQLKPEKEKLLDVHHKIVVEDGQQFFWSDKYGGGILDKHLFRVERTSDNRTRFIQSDMAKGGMTWLLGGTIVKRLLPGYQAFNRSLKVEVEKRYSNE